MEVITGIIFVRNASQFPSSTGDSSIVTGITIVSVFISLSGAILLIVSRNLSQSGLELFREVFQLVSPGFRLFTS